MLLLRPGAVRTEPLPSLPAGTSLTLDSRWPEEEARSAAALAAAPFLPLFFLPLFFLGFVAPADGGLSAAAVVAVAEEEGWAAAAEEGEGAAPAFVAGAEDDGAAAALAVGAEEEGAAMAVAGEDEGAEGEGCSACCFAAFAP